MVGPIAVFNAICETSSLAKTCNCQLSRLQKLLVSTFETGPVKKTITNSHLNLELEESIKQH